MRRDNLVAAAIAAHAGRYFDLIDTLYVVEKQSLRGLSTGRLALGRLLVGEMRTGLLIGATLALLATDRDVDVRQQTRNVGRARDLDRRWCRDHARGILPTTATIDQRLADGSYASVA